MARRRPHWRSRQRQQTASLALFIVGVSYIAALATANVTVQTLVPTRFKGRILAIYWMAFSGAYPLASLLKGWLADEYGVRVVLASFGVALAALSILLAAERTFVTSIDEHEHS